MNTKFHTANLTPQCRTIVVLDFCLTVQLTIVLKQAKYA